MAACGVLRSIRSAAPLDLAGVSAGIRGGLGWQAERQTIAAGLGPVGSTKYLSTANGRGTLATTGTLAPVSFAECMEQDSSICSEEKGEDIVPIKGSLYVYWAVGMELDWRVVVVLCAQFFLPLGLLLWQISAVEWGKIGIGVEKWRVVVGKEERSAHMWITHFTCLVFVFLQLLHAVKSLENEAVDWLKVRLLLENVLVVSSKPIWMAVGAVVSCYLYIMCSMVFFLFTLMAKNPQEVVFDAISIGFFYTLDNISDFGLLGASDWNDYAVGRAYRDKMRAWMKRFPERWQNTDPRDGGSDSEECLPEPDPDLAVLSDNYSEYMRLQNRLHPAFVFTKWTLRMFMVLLPIAFVLIQGLHRKPDREQLEVEGLLSYIDVLHEKHRQSQSERISGASSPSGGGSANIRVG